MIKINKHLNIFILPCSMNPINNTMSWHFQNTCAHYNCSYVTYSLTVCWWKPRLCVFPGSQWTRSSRCRRPCWPVAAASRASVIASFWRPLSSTGTRTAWAATCVAADSGRWAADSTTSWEGSCAGETTSGWLRPLDTVWGSVWCF